MSKHKKHYKPKPNFNKPTSTVNQPHKKDSKKTLSFWLVIIFFLICGIGSILGTYSFVENRVKADEVSYNFTGSNVSVPFATDYYTNPNGSFTVSGAPYIASTMFRMKYTFVNGQRTVYLLSNTNSTLDGGEYYNLFLSLFPPNPNFSGGDDWHPITSSYIGVPVLYYKQSSTKINAFTVPIGSSSSTLSVLSANTASFLDTANQQYNFGIPIGTGNYSSYWYFVGELPYPNVSSLEHPARYIITMHISCNSAFDGNVSHISQGADTLYDYNWNYIKYHSANDGELAFRFRLHASAFSAGNNNSSNYLLSNRIYVVDFENLDGYDVGYTAGLNANQPNIYQDGYNTGFTAGKNNGYDIGFNDGVDQASNFNFFSLMSAVVDAPVQAVTGLLDFEIFGFDMSSFFFGFLTISLVVFVLRKVL